jgi:hypothetical protein
LNIFVGNGLLLIDIRAEPMKAQLRILAWGVFEKTCEITWKVKVKGKIPPKLWKGNIFKNQQIRFEYVYKTNVSVQHLSRPLHQLKRYSVCESMISVELEKLS